ncbi:MAG: ABC transporter substrate-binding protein, partial [Christensenellales bacterium]
MKRTRLTLVITLIVAMLFSFGAVAQANDSAKTAVIIGVAAEPDAFFVCHSVNGTNMDEAPVIHSIYDSLIRRNVDGSYTGLLATEWTMSEDGLSYTFKIRPGVKYSDGTDMPISDIPFSLNYTATTKAGQQQLVNYDYTEAIDDETVVVHLTSPYGGFLNALANRYGLVYSERYFNEVGEDGYDAMPITTGPYKFVEYVSGAHVKLTYNEHYWGEMPQITDITFRTMTDINTQMIALENKEIDVLLNANISPLLRLDPDGDVTYAVTSAAQYATLMFNMKDGIPVADENLRLAIAHAINKEEINFGANENMAEVADCIIPTGFNARPIPGTYDAYAFDLAKAQEYLAASGYNGEEVRIVTVSGTKDEIICQIIQGQLINLGLNCTLVAADAATYNDYTGTSGDYSMALRSGSSSLMDADMMLYVYNEDVSTRNFD